MRERARLRSEEGLGECGHRVLDGVGFAFVCGEGMDAGQDAGFVTGSGGTEGRPIGQGSGGHPSRLSISVAAAFGVR